MRILEASYWFAHAMLDRANELSKRHDVMFLTTLGAVKWAATEGWRDLFRPEIDLRVERDTRRRNPLYYAERILGFWKGVCRFRPDVVHYQGVGDHMVNRFYAHLDGVPLVHTVHDPVPHLGDHIPGYNKREPMINAVRRRADWIIVHGQGVKDQLLKVNPELDPERVSVILLGAWKYMLRWKLPQFAEKPGTVLFFGRINAYKGLGVLLDSWRYVREECANARLIIAGSGRDLDNHRERMAADQTIELIDRVVSTPEVARLFAESSVVVLPYVEATQSGPLAIALAYGKPVVATRVGGLPEMIDEGRSGLVVPPRDSEALAEALVKVLRDDALRQRLAQGTLELSSGRLSPAALADQTEQVYRNAIEYYRQRSSC